MEINNKLLEDLLEQAAANPRLRQNMDLRNSAEDTSQRMLNAMLPGTFIPIHRHKDTTETLVLLTGRMEEIFYDENNDFKESERILLSSSGPVKGLCIEKGRWHNINVLEPTVIVECKDGSYQPLGSDDVIQI